MKRILSLFLVGILLLPSLLACGKAPQATAPATETTPAIAEIPAVEIGESGASMEGFSIDITDATWTQEKACFKLNFSFPSDSIAITKSFRVRILKWTNNSWEIFQDYNKQRNGVERWTKIADPDTPQKQGIYWGLTDIFNRFESGTYRLSVVYKAKIQADEAEVDVEAWTDFKVSGMPLAQTAGKRTDVSFAEQFFAGVGEKTPQEPPRFTVIRSLSQLEDYLKDNDAMRAYTAHCDEAYFNERMLIVFCSYQDSAGNKCAVDFINTDEDGRLYVGIHCVSKSGIPEGAYTTMLIEPKIKAEKNEDVILYYNGFKVDFE